MKPKWIGSMTGSRIALMPRRSAASAARSSEAMSPCVGRDQHRHGGRSGRDIEGLFGEAEQEVRARRAAAPQFDRVAMNRR